ncbi:hypothetical protein [Natrinema gelatinilyticum]|uniref:hypothetical protein n=1 Tax=Natrinema gelatinilyticum TaxID=2961571 RepID=UPI0020C4C799|nr:hypothetical protein [Natrinema gelatinilyticum]
MSQKNEREWETPESNMRGQLAARLTATPARVMATPESQAVSSLVFLALLIFAFLALGNYAQLW